MKLTIALVLLGLVVLVNSQRHRSSQRARLSECQRMRERTQQRLVVGGLVPNCEENGDFAPLQCHPPSVRGKRFCQCWRKDGTPITQPSTKIQACNCIKHKDEVQATLRKRRVLGAFEPTCQENGSYHPKQCHASTGLCFCVNESGQNTTSPSRPPVNC